MVEFLQVLEFILTQFILDLLKEGLVSWQHLLRLSHLHRIRLDLFNCLPKNLSQGGTRVGLRRLGLHLNFSCSVEIYLLRDHLTSLSNHKPILELDHVDSIRIEFGVFLFEINFKLHAKLSEFDIQLLIELE